MPQVKTLDPALAHTHTAQELAAHWAPVLAEKSQDFIFVVSRNLQVEYVNPICVKHLRRSVHAVIGQEISVLFPAKLAQRYQQSLHKVFRSGKTMDFENFIYFPKQTLFIHTRLVPIRDGAGKVAHVLGISRDITARKCIEDRLRESEQKFRAQYDGLTVPTYTWQKCGRDFVMVDYNRAAARLTKGGVAQLLGKEIAVFFHGRQDIITDVKKCFQHHRTIERQTRIHLVATVEPKDFHIRSVFVPPDLVMVQTEDISELLRTKEQVDRLARIVRDTQEAVVLIDLGNKNVIRYVNHAWQKLLGYKASEVVNKRQALIIEAIERDPALAARFWKSVKQGKIFTSELLMQRKDGQRIWVEVYTFPVTSEKERVAMWANMIRDIHDRKEREQEMHDHVTELEKFKQALEGVSDHVIITDPDGKILFANRAVEIITGYAPEEALGKNPGQLWGGHMPKAYYVKMWNTIKLRKKPHVGEVTNQRKDGREYKAEINISPILDSHGQIRFFVGIERDVTKLREVDRMKSEFVSLASHQLRMPLTAIKWLVELLQMSETGPLTNDQREHLDQISRSTERMIHLINDLLDVSRIETGIKFIVERKPTDVRAVFDGTVQMFSSFASDHHVSLSWLPSMPKHLRLSVDASKLAQAYQNFLSNAIKYSRPGGVVELGAEIKAGQDPVFFVRDHGYGIPKYQESRVYQKFFRGDNIVKIETEGTGLGLYIAKAFVEAQGGKTWFSSEENKGTTFYFSLPRLKEKTMS